MSETLPTLVVFGLDPEDKPRAGCFAEPDAGLAFKAAALLSYRVARISDAEVLEVLPDGNVFARGNGFIGRVSLSVFDKLIAEADEAAWRLKKRGCDEGELGRHGSHPCPQ